MVFKKGWSKVAKDAKDKADKAAAETINPPETKAPESPIAKAFYIEKEKGKWRMVIADIQDDKVISRQIKECDNKGMSLETFKIAFAKHYYFGR